jgi:hypothetical protein
MSIKSNIYKKSINDRIKAKNIHKNENQNWYKNQILKDENTKKFKTEYISIKSLMIKFNIVSK